MFLQPINYFILDFLFYFVHPFFIFFFLRIVDNSKNIRMNYLTTRDFDIRQQEILQPYHPITFIQRFCDPIIQRFCDPIIQRF